MTSKKVFFESDKKKSNDENFMTFKSHKYAFKFSKVKTQTLLYFIENSSSKVFTLENCLGKTN